MAKRAPPPEEKPASNRVKVTFYLEEEEDYLIEGIVREKKRLNRSYSKAQYFRDLMANDPAFVSARRSSGNPSRKIDLFSILQIRH